MPQVQSCLFSNEYIRIPAWYKCQYYTNVWTVNYYWSVRIEKADLVFLNKVLILSSGISHELKKVNQNVSRIYSYFFIISNSVDNRKTNIMPYSNFGLNYYSLKKDIVMIVRCYFDFLNRLANNTIISVLLYRLSLESSVLLFSNFLVYYGWGRSWIVL